MDEIKGIRIVSLIGEKEYGIEDSEVREELANVVDGAPEELDSFKEAFEKFKEGGEALAGVTADVTRNAEAIAAETERALNAEETLGKSIAAEAERARSAEEDIKTKAIAIDNINYSATKDDASIELLSIDGENSGSVTLPAATTEKAGVMSAEDKKALDNVPNAIEDAITEESKVTDEKIAKEKARAEQTEQTLANDIANAPNIALRALFVAAGAEYNDTNNHIVKYTPWRNLVDSIDYKAQWNLDVVTGSVQTLTYGGKSYEYVDDNGTWKIIARVGDKLIWDDTKVIHRKGYYYLNGLGDITEDQMMTIYNAGIYKGAVNYYTGYNDIRTFLPAKISGQEGYGAFQIRGLVAGCKNIEVVHFASERGLTEQYGVSIESPSNISNAFRGCNNLKYIQAIALKANATVTGTFNGCRELVWIKLFNLAVNLGLASSSKISKESIRFVIQKAKPTTAIAITLHHVAYVRLTADQEVLDDLTAKNEAFTAEGKGGKISLVCATHSEEITPNA